MHSVHEIAQQLNLQKTRLGYQGKCPVCDYPGAFNVTEKNGKFLAYCHAGRCSWESIRYVLQVQRILPLKDIAGCNQTFSQIGSKKDAPLSQFHLELWAKSKPILNTLGESYLRERDITIPLPDSLRFLRWCFHSPSEQRFPALIAQIEHVLHEFPIGIHRTYLKQAAAEKANVEPNKMILGKTQGGAIRLAEATDQLAITEGIENGLSVLQATGIPTWAALSCGNFLNLVLPRSIRKLIICADHDKPGLRFAMMAARQWRSQGIKVNIATPPEKGTDFNDLLRRGGQS